MFFAGLAIWGDQSVDLLNAHQVIDCLIIYPLATLSKQLSQVKLQLTNYS